MKYLMAALPLITMVIDYLIGEAESPDHPRLTKAKGALSFLKLLLSKVEGQQ